MIPIYRAVDEVGQGLPYRRCTKKTGMRRIVSVDDIILAFYGMGAIFPVVTLLASFLRRRDGGPI